MPLALEPCEPLCEGSVSIPYGQGLLPKDFMPRRSRDLVERIDVSSRNVVDGTQHPETQRVQRSLYRYREELSESESA